MINFILSFLIWNSIGSWRERIFVYRGVEIPIYSNYYDWLILKKSLKVLEFSPTGDSVSNLTKIIVFPKFCGDPNRIVACTIDFGRPAILNISPKESGWVEAGVSLTHEGRHWRRQGLKWNLISHNGTFAKKDWQVKIFLEARGE